MRVTERLSCCSLSRYWLISNCRVEFLLEEVSFVCKVNAIHPSVDPYGSEYVCIEFAVEAQRPPSVIQVPPNMPQELSAVMPLLSQIPKMLPQSRTHANRLVIFLTPQEWEHMKRKFQFGDEAEVKIGPDGSIRVQLI